MFWSAGKPSQLHSQHLGSQCRYLDSVVWEAKPTIFNILAAKTDSLVLVSWAAKPAIVSILTANVDILIQLSGRPSQQCLTILAAKTDSLVSWEA
jgi:hypothetical protein